MPSISERPITVYLDSSDFSVMSDPKHGHEWQDEFQALKRYVAQGDVRCVFSQAHLVEMAPLDRSRAAFSVHKVDLLMSLCGGFALPSLDRLISLELLALREDRPRVEDIIVNDGKWYPLIDNVFSEMDTKQFTTEAISEAIAQFTGNRAQKREAQRRLLKDGKPSVKALKIVRSADLGNDVMAFQKIYPMRDDDAKIIIKYFRGGTTRTEAQQAFESSLRDPRFMMRWFSSEGIDVSKFTSWLRSSSLKMKATVEDFSAIAQSIRELPEHQRNTVEKSTVLAKEKWDRQADALTGRVAQRLADEFLNQKSVLPLERLHQTCAGLSTMIGTFLDAAWTSTTKQPRTPLASDLGDSYHAMYSPYVDIFRPDGFMAPHVARRAKEFGTLVIPKLRQLIPAIEARLADKTRSAG